MADYYSVSSISDPFEVIDCAFEESNRGLLELYSKPNSDSGNTRKTQAKTIQEKLLCDIVEMRRTEREKFKAWSALIEFEAKTTRQLRDEMETFEFSSEERARYSNYLDRRALIEAHLDMSRGYPSLRSEPGCTTSELLKELRELAWRYQHIIENSLNADNGVPLEDIWRCRGIARKIATKYVEALLEKPVQKPVHRIFDLVERLAIIFPQHSMDATVEKYLRAYATTPSNDPDDRADVLLEKILA